MLSCLGTLSGQPRATFKISDPPSGETWADFRKRVVQAINTGLAKSDYPLFVAHGAVFRAFIDALKVEHARLNNCELVKFVVLDNPDRWYVEKQKQEKVSCDE